MAQGKREVRWADEAWNDFIRTLGFYDERNQSTTYSEKLESLVWKKLDYVSVFPESGEQIKNDSARFVIVENVVLIYEVQEDAILVQAFRDARRRPED